jgi:Peptidase A4 family
MDRSPSSGCPRQLPYRAFDFGDHLHVTMGQSGPGRQVLAALFGPLVMALAVTACLPGPTPSPSEGAVASGSAPSASLAASTAPTASTSPTAAIPVAAKPAPCPGTDKTPKAAPGRQVLGSSANWSGYVAATRHTAVTCVEGSWVEPSVTCPRTGHQAVAIWIGIDGFSASTLGIPSTDVLVQIGTQADCQDGVSSHGAWHEILPGEGNEVHVPGLVRAGDHLSARILFTGGEFSMAIFDAETLFSYSLTAPAPGAPRHSAEWIVEAPAEDCPGICKAVPLPRFSTVTFTGARATIGGQRAAINNETWTNVKLRMVRNGIVRTSTSKLLSGGTSFRVTFVHS